MAAKPTPKSTRKTATAKSKKSEKQEPAALEAQATAAAPVAIQAPSVQDMQMLQMMQAVNARLGQIEANSIDVRGPAPSPAQGKAADQSCCGGQCCCFDIIISRARVLKEQSGLIPIPGVDEPGDANLGVLDPLNRYMEMQFNVIAADLSALAPSLGSFLPMNRAGGHQPIGKKIGTLTVNGSRSVPVMAEAREVETSVLGGRAEHGASETGYLQLTCGCPVIPVMLQVALDSGGNAGGLVEVEVTAIQTCCDSC